MKTLIIKTIAVLMLLLLTSESPCVQSSASGTLHSLTYTLYYELPGNAGLMSVKLNINTGSEVLVLNIPIAIFENGVLECLNYTVTPGLLVLGFDFNRELSLLQLLVSGEGVIEVLFNVQGIFSELVSEYSVVIDTTELKGLAQSATIEMYITGIYEVYITKFHGVASTRWYTDGNLTKLEITGFTWLEITLCPELTITTPPETTETEDRSSEFSYNPILLLMLGTIALILATLATLYLYRYLKRRGPDLTIEYIDYFKDSSAKQILLTLGESGEQGLTQSEISRKTGLPKSTISRKLRRLLEDGIVEVKPSGKYNYVVLTPKGYSIYRRLKEEADKK